MSTVRPKECIMLYTVPPFSPRPLFLGDTNMAVFHVNPSRLCGQAISTILILIGSIFRWCMRS